MKCVALFLVALVLAMGVSANAVYLEKQFQKTFVFNGVQYDVEALVIADDSVKLRINGMITDALEAGDTERLPDGAQLSVLSVSPRQSVEFVVSEPVVNVTLAATDVGPKLCAMVPASLKSACIVDYDRIADTLMSPEPHKSAENQGIASNKPRTFRFLAEKHIVEISGADALRVVMKIDGHEYKMTLGETVILPDCTYLKIHALNGAANQAYVEFFDKANYAREVYDTVIEATPPVVKQDISPPSFPGDDTVELKLYRGWNLVSLPGKLVKFLDNDCVKKPVAYVYLKERGKYASLEEASDVLQDKFRIYLADNAFWIYSYDDCVQKVVVNRNYKPTIVIDDGWNLIPDFQGLRLNCADCQEFWWDSEVQDWSAVEIARENVGRLVRKVR